MNRRGRGYGYAGASEWSYVSKSFERMMKARLEVFANGSENELKIDSMSREERRIIHGIAQKMGLQSRSTGKEPNRVLSISRPPSNHMRQPASCESDAIQLCDDQAALLTDFLNKHPVRPANLELHRTAHKKLNHSKQLMGICGQEEMFVPPPNSSSAEMNKFRRNLPTYAYRQQILDTIKDHKVTLITGGTGCGKTTQVPQFLLEEAYQEGRKIRIVVTQPRRLPAIAVAERVSKERNERLGSTVGYHIRLEQKTSKETVLTYCTSGVLLRMLTVDENASDVSHIILDEIHEREQNTDYLLIALKQALTRRNDLKVILMSATMEGNIDMFLDYFDGEKVGHVDVPSRLYDVEKFYLADVLALTAYSPPATIFGGMFSDMFSNLGFGNNRRFPPVGNFEETEISTVGTESNTAKMPSYSTPGPSSRFDSNSVANTVLSGRPMYFTPKFIKNFRDVLLDETTLIENYMNNGGQQWSEGVDPDLTVATIRYCMDSPVDGAILVFLPGYENILSVRDKVIKELDDCKTKAEVFTLHSQMNSADQQRVFDKVFNKRKVILSTNIAEASLTIDDVVFVIDCGKVKEKTYDHQSRISQLNVTWIAKSNAEQRSGRAGRCRPGFCFRLYSREEHHSMLLAQVAEMKRSAIHEVCLHAKMFAPENIPVKRFLEMAPEPPLAEAIDRSLQFLEVLGALHGEETFMDPSGRFQTEPGLTELGRHLAHLPLDPQLARLLLFGIALKCCHPIVTLVSSLAHRDPFVLPLGDERNSALTARDEFSHCDYSDHITLVRAFYAYSQCTNSNNRQLNFCRSKFLSANTMKMVNGISRQLMQELRRLNLIPHGVHWDDQELNRYSTCWPVIQAAIVAGCYPGIGLVRPGTKLKKIKTCSISASATLHPGCVIKRQMGPYRRSEKLSSYLTGSGEDPKFEYLAYQELSKIDEGVTIRTVTAVPPLSVFLFAGSIRMSAADIESFKLDHDKDEAVATPQDITAKFDPQTRNCFLTLGDDLVVRGMYKDFRKLMQLRVKFMSYFMEVMKNPSRTENNEDKELLECLKDLLVSDHKKCGFYECDLSEPKALRCKDGAPTVTHNELPKIRYNDESEYCATRTAITGGNAQKADNLFNIQYVPASRSYSNQTNNSRNNTHQHQPKREASIPEHTFDKVMETQADEWGPGYDMSSNSYHSRKMRNKQGTSNTYRGNNRNVGNEISRPVQNNNYGTATGSHGYNGSDRGTRYQKKKNLSSYRGNSNHQYRNREYGITESREDSNAAPPNGFGNSYNRHYSAR